ncbi:MAG: hypothetical protein JF614_20670 [Acidobacteria bacterium]|nr:hypothetical protein [Acidobacteriota bacterium]
MPDAAIGLNAVIVAVTEEVPRILTVRRELAAGGPAEDALPFGPLEPETDRTLDRGLRRWVREQTGLDLGYVEQLYTFGDRNRDPRESHGGPRLVSVAYLALVREVSVSGEARWRDWYEFFPWEDWRDGHPAILDRLAPALDSWVAAAPNPRSRQERRERAEIVFGLGGVAWDGERVLERYELLYEAGLVPEARRDRIERGEADRLPPEDAEPLPARAMALDHRRILATALGRLRGKLKYRPVVFELLPPTFTLLQLQRVVEALAGVRLHKQNFRRLVETGGLVEGTGRQDAQTGGRPAELFVFRREVLRERPAPGVGLPGLRRP